MEKKTLKSMVLKLIENSCDQLQSILDAADKKICNLEKENTELKLRIKGLEADIKGMEHANCIRKKSNQVTLITTRFELHNRNLAISAIKSLTNMSDEFAQHYVDHAMNQTIKVSSDKAEDLQTVLNVCGIYTKIVS